VSVVLVIQHVKRTRRVILSPVACLAIPHFSISSHKRQAIREKVRLLNIMCASKTFLSETVLILRRIRRIVSYVYIDLYVKYPSFLLDFNKT
jgi:hypothetical protein